MISFPLFKRSEQSAQPSGSNPPTKPPPESPTSHSDEAKGDSRPASVAPLPLPEVHRAESLEQFHHLLRRHYADRVYLDLLDNWANDPSHEVPRYWIVLSATRGGADMIAHLPFRSSKRKDEAGNLDDAITYLNVLRNRFKFLGYATGDGLCTSRLNGELTNFKAPAPHAESA